MNASTTTLHAKDLDWALWCARSCLEARHHPPTAYALSQTLQLILQQDGHEDALVLIQASLECLQGRIKPVVLEALIERWTPRPQRGDESSDLDPGPSRRALTTSQTMVRFEEATRLAVTALSMAPKTTEAHAFAHGISFHE